MKKDKQSKIIAILAIFISVLGLTLGFAAFSNTLTISSRATVSPEEADFNINVYGIVDWQDVKGYPPHELYTSSTSSVPLRGLNGSYPAQSGTTAKITDNGKSITISDINIGFSDGGTASYFFMVKNEGQYDAYLDLTESWEDFSYPIYGECTAGTDASPELVAKACDSIVMYRYIENSDGIGTTGGEYITIPKGDYIELEISIDYLGDNRADGDFTASFEDFTLEFTSVPPAE